MSDRVRGYLEKGKIGWPYAPTRMVASEPSKCFKSRDWRANAQPSTANKSQPLSSSPTAERIPTGSSHREATSRAPPPDVASPEKSTLCAQKPEMKAKPRLDGETRPVTAEKASAASGQPSEKQLKQELQRQENITTYAKKVLEPFIKLEDIVGRFEQRKQDAAARPNNRQCVDLYLGYASRLLSDANLFKCPRENILKLIPALGNSGSFEYRPDFPTTEVVDKEIKGLLAPKSFSGARFRQEDYHWILDMLKYLDWKEHAGKQDAGTERTKKKVATSLYWRSFDYGSKRELQRYMFADALKRFQVLEALRSKMSTDTSASATEAYIQATEILTKYGEAIKHAKTVYDSSAPKPDQLEPEFSPSDTIVVRSVDNRIRREKSYKSILVAIASPRLVSDEKILETVCQLVDSLVPNKDLKDKPFWIG